MDTRDSQESIENFLQQSPLYGWLRYKLGYKHLKFIDTTPFDLLERPKREKPLNLPIPCKISKPFPLRKNIRRFLRQNKRRKRGKTPSSEGHRRTRSIIVSPSPLLTSPGQFDSKYSETARQSPKLRRPKTTDLYSKAYKQLKQSFRSSVRYRSPIGTTNHSSYRVSWDSQLDNYLTRQLTQKWQQQYFMSKVDIVKKRYKYKSFHYNSSVYEVGESIQIQGYSEHPAFGKILQVQRDISTQEFILKIQWYYTHDDFPKWDFISKSEMFLTNEEQEIELLDIFRKIVVSPFEEFKWLDEAEDYEYCTRATYCPSTGGRFDPPTSQWEQTGCWLKILNPDHVHVIWENWQKWQHVEWIKESEDDFTICDQCKNEVHI